MDFKRYLVTMYINTCVIFKNWMRNLDNANSVRIFLKHIHFLGIMLLFRFLTKQLRKYIRQINFIIHSVPIRLFQLRFINLIRLVTCNSCSAIAGLFCSENIFSIEIICIILAHIKYCTLTGLFIYLINDAVRFYNRIDKIYSVKCAHKTIQNICLSNNV